MNAFFTTWQPDVAHWTFGLAEAVIVLGLMEWRRHRKERPAKPRQWRGDGYTFTEVGGYQGGALPANRGPAPHPAAWGGETVRRAYSAPAKTYAIGDPKSNTPWVEAVVSTADKLTGKMVDGMLTAFTGNGGPYLGTQLANLHYHSQPVAMRLAEELGKTVGAELGEDIKAGHITPKRVQQLSEAGLLDPNAARQLLDAYGIPPPMIGGTPGLTPEVAFNATLPYMTWPDPLRCSPDEED